MPPRFQCLNGARVLRQQEVFSRATFSTTSRVLANRPSASDDLLSIGEDTTPNIPLPIRRLDQSTRPRNSFSQQRNPSGPSSRNPNATAGALNLMNRAAAQNPGRSQNQQPVVSTMESLEKQKLGSDLSKQISRRWKAGDVYAPHDLSPVEMQKWKNRSQPEYDVFDVLDLNPIQEYKNFAMMSEYMTPMGRIMHSKMTGLRPVNQRRISKAIRRSIGLGLMPSVYRHPEILFKQVMRRNEQLSSASRQL